MELKPRIKDGVESDTHFLYTDSKGREWSVVDFKKMMDKAAPFGYSDYYNWEGMYLGEDKDKLESDQFRGMTAEEVIKQIESMEAPKEH